MLGKKQKYSIQEARRRMASFCALQDRSHFEVENKLKQWGIPFGDILEIKSYLIEHDFLNEQRFANSFARGKFRIKNWGRTKIVIELKNRFINERIIKTALKEIDENEYKACLERLVLKKKTLLKASTFDLKTKQKITNYLLQKGFEYEYINEALSNKL